MAFGKTELLILDRHAVFQHLRELAALGIQSAIPKVDNRRLRLFADDDARCSGHHFPKVVARERGELFWFHERGFLPDIDSRAFDWRERRIFDGINLEPSSNNDALGFSCFGDVR